MMPNSIKPSNVVQTGISFFISSSYACLSRAVERVDLDLKESFYKKIQQTFIAGGLLANHVQKSPVKDIDIFCIDNQSVRDLSDILFELNSNKNKNKPFDITAHTDNAISFKIANPSWLEKDLYDPILSNITFQLITRQWGLPQDVINNFDFVHCMAACNTYNWINKRKPFVMHPEFYECAKNKILRYNSLQKDCEINTLRLHKFLKRGYTLESDKEYGLALLRRLSNEEEYKKEQEKWQRDS